MPNGEVFVGELRVVHGVLHIKSRGAASANTDPNDRDSQGKNARQSHPGKIPLNSGLRAMRLPSSSALLSDSQTGYPTRSGRSMCAMSPVELECSCTQTFRGKQHQ